MYFYEIESLYGLDFTDVYETLRRELGPDRILTKLVSYVTFTMIRLRSGFEILLTVEDRTREPRGTFRSLHQ